VKLVGIRVRNLLEGVVLDRNREPLGCRPPEPQLQRVVVISKLLVQLREGIDILDFEDSFGLRPRLRGRFGFGKRDALV